MVNLTLSEATLNAVRAALNERVARLEAETLRLEWHQGSRLDEREPAAMLPCCEDAQRALVWNIAALHETKTAVEDFAEVNLPEQFDPITAAKSYAEWEAWTEGELVAEFGR